MKHKDLRGQICFILAYRTGQGAPSRPALGGDVWRPQAVLMGHAKLLHVLQQAGKLLLL